MPALQARMLGHGVLWSVNTGDAGVAQLDQVAGRQRRAAVLVQQRGVNRRTRRHVQKDARHLGKAAANLGGPLAAQRSVDQHPIHLTLREDPYRLGQAAQAVARHHRDHQTVPGFAGGLLDGGGELRRRVQGDVVGRKPDRKAALPRQALRQAVGHVIELADRFAHAGAGVGRHPALVVDHPRDGLRRDARQPRHVGQRRGPVLRCSVHARSLPHNDVKPNIISVPPA